MNRYALLVCSIACVLAASSGCCHFHGMFGCPCGPGIAICDPTHCCDACGPACGDACGPACCDACGPACACDPVPACDPCIDSCGDVCCDACCGPYDACGCRWGPLTWVFRIFSCGYFGSGCGQCYWSDFHSEPPDCCDPCDQWGNWTGGGCCTACGQCGGWGGGCDACGGGYCQSPQQPRGLLAGNRPWTQVPAQGHVITDPSSPYAPRVVSVTERVVSPTPTKAAPAPQTAAKQVAKPKLTTIPR